MLVSARGVFISTEQAKQCMPSSCKSRLMCILLLLLWWHCPMLRHVLFLHSQVKWKDFVSDINLIPQTLDVERTGGLDLGIGTIPMPFATFKKSE
jgi:hypothetical protein